jgi:hypothetical protein
MRQLIGVGTPRGLQGRLIAVVTALFALIRSLWDCTSGHGRPVERVSPSERYVIAEPTVVHICVREMVFTTGC